jgi:hypothetical protein
MMKWKECESKRSWGRGLTSGIILIYPWIWLRKTTENLSQDARYPGRISNSIPREYALGALPREAIRFVSSPLHPKQTQNLNSLTCRLIVSQHT